MTTAPALIPDAVSADAPIKRSRGTGARSTKKKAKEAVPVTPLSSTLPEPEIVLVEQALPTPPAPSPVLAVPTPTPVAVAVTPAPATTTDATTAVPVVEDEKKRKRTAGKDKLLVDFEALTLKLAPIIETQKTLWKEFQKVKSDTYKLLKLKTTERRTKDVSNSGFMKPVRVSRELELFLQRDNALTDTLTRAYLTATLCEYIKKHNLQNPQDKRIIFPDDNLKRLFQLGDSEAEPLTYYNIQKRIQSHIFKLEPPADATATAVKS